MSQLVFRLVFSVLLIALAWALFSCAQNFLTLWRLYRVERSIHRAARPFAQKVEGLRTSNPPAYKVVMVMLEFDQMPSTEQIAAKVEMPVAEVLQILFWLEANGIAEGDLSGEVSH